MNDDMLRFRNYIWLLLLMTVGLIACQSDVYSTQTESKSGFYISLCDDVSVDSRATPSELGAPVASNFDLKITNKETGNLLYDGKFTDGLIPAAQGEYRIVASYGSNLELGLDTPYYEGTADGVVETDKATTVSVQCRVANALASAVFSNSEVFEKEFSSYALKVSVGSQYVTLKPTDNKSAYYRAGAHPSFAFVGVMTDGTRVEIPIENEKLQDEATFAAAAHCKITLTMEATSGLKLKIEKIEVEKVTVSETIPVEWLPKPKVSGFEDITYVETDDAPQNAVIDYTASLPIQDMELTLNMQDEQYSIYNKTYTLSTLTSEDRANLGKLGIELPEVGVAKTGTINLQNLIGTMQTNAGATVDNTFSLRVKANNRWSDETASAKTYKVEVVKPEFSVSVYPGNIWTKEFTVNPLAENEVTKGKFEKLNSSLEYQYSVDNVNWETINSSNLRQQGLTSGKKYYVRAYYRNAVPSTVKTIETGGEIAILYGDMESWVSETKKLIPGANIFKSVKITGYNPDNNIWACVNQKTFGGSPNINSTYNLNPSTYRETGRNGKGYAAALRTVGWDNGSGNTTSIIYHISAGKLFIGSYSFTHKSGPENYNYGMVYNSRPTALKAYFTYSPYSGDSFKAWIVLENRDNVDDVKRIGYGEVVKGDAVSSFTELNIPITYDSKYQEYAITHMYVVFSSSAACSENEGDETNNLKGKVTGGDYHNGSVLVIDDVSLVYDK